MRYLTIKRPMAPARPAKRIQWRYCSVLTTTSMYHLLISVFVVSCSNEQLFPAAEIAFHRKYSHLDYFAARELLRRGTLTPEQVAAGDYSQAPAHVPSKPTDDKLT